MRVGIYAGTFDPVHEGHEAFAMKAIEARAIDRLWIIPEREPRAKSDVTPVAHRLAMLRRVFESRSACRVAQLTLPHAQFPQCFEELSITDAADILIGSDVALGLQKWQNLRDLLKHTHFVIGVRNDTDAGNVHQHMDELGLKSSEYTTVEALFADHTSSVVRHGLRSPHPETLSYIQKHSLYTV